MSDAAARCGDRGKECKSSQDRDEPLCGNGKDEEDDDPVRKQKPKRKQHPVKRPRGPDDRNGGVWREQNREKRGADSADEEEFREPARSPQAL